MNNKKSKRVIRTFSLASFLNDMGSDIIYPLWPIFVTEILKANMTVLGFIDGLGEAIVSISQAISGYLSDKIGKRKVFIWVGYLLGAISRVGYALSSSWIHLIPFKVMDRFGKIRGSPRDAMVSEVSNKKNRGKNFGILRLMDNLGAVVGIILSILLISFLNYRTLFMLAAIPSFISSILVLSLIKDRKTSKKEKHRFAIRNFSKDFKIFLLLSSIFSLASFSYSFMLVYSKRFFPGNIIPIFYLLFTVVAMASSLPFGKLADRIGRKNVVRISYLLFGLMCIGFILVKSYYWLFFLFILYGLHLGSYVPAQKALVSELSPKGLKASGLGVYQMFVGLLALPASLIAGFLWDNLGANSPFYLSFVLTLISLIILEFLRKD